MQSFSPPERLLLSPIDLNTGFIRAGENTFAGRRKRRKKMVLKIFLNSVSVAQKVCIGFDV